MAFYPHCNKHVKYTVNPSNQHCKTKKAEPWLYQVLSLLLVQRASLFFVLYSPRNVPPDSVNERIQSRKHRRNPFIFSCLTRGYPLHPILIEVRFICTGVDTSRPLLDTCIVPNFCVKR